MHKRESDPENEIHKILLDFMIEKYYSILARRPDFVIINKKKKKRIYHLVDFTVPTDRINF